MSSTPPKNNEPRIGVITPVATKKVFDIDNKDLKPFTRYIEDDPQAYSAAEYESSTKGKKAVAAREVVNEVNHYYKSVMDWKHGELPSREKVLKSAVRTICADNSN